MKKNLNNGARRGRGVGTASPHVEGAERPDPSGPDGSGPILSPSKRAPRGGRKIAVVSPSSPSENAPSPEVLDRPIRRQFTAEYKLRILQELDGSQELGSVGRVLRREGLHSSVASSWRRQRDAGSLTGLAPKKRGRKPEPVNPLTAKYAQLERKNRHLEKRLRRTEILLELQKKIADLYGVSLNDPDNEGKP